MRLTARRLRTRLAVQEGFTMPAVLAAMLVVMLLSVAAIAAASGDINLARGDQDDKQAFAAAEAGINDYLGNLNTDTNYWAKCTGVSGASPVNQKGVPDASRKWRDVPGSANSEYSIELIPAPGKSTCDPSDPSDAVTSMVDEGNIRIRSTGRIKNSNRSYRTATATFRRAGFLDFLYFTDLENQDPTYIQRTPWALGSRATDTRGNPTGGPTLLEWAADKCQRHWWGTQATQGTGRQEKPFWRGQYLTAGGSYSSLGNRYDDVDTDDICGEITFITGDRVNGPFHSNDDILVSGAPVFGRPGKGDRVEVSGTGYRPTTAAPVFNPSPLRTQAAQLDPPATNQALEAQADPGYKFTGQTTLVLNGTNMTVTNAGVSGGSPTSMPLPPNGVVYVANGTCGSRYNPTSWDTAAPGCGDVRISGTYSKSLTIGAQNDVIVTGDVKRADNNDSLLGLISDQFVRIWHPVNQSGSNYNACTTLPSSPRNVRVDAAILTLTGSFTVDNYWCGGPLGTLTVNGAIAQLHRGVVGSGANTNGYLKSYNYNEDLKFRSPPHFLDPLQASWRILRQGEQSPPCVKTTAACPPGPA